MNNIVEDHGENRFANGQSSRDLRAILCGAELETQLIEAVDNVGDFLQSSRGEGAWRMPIQESPLTFDQTRAVSWATMAPFH